MRLKNITRRQFIIGAGATCILGASGLGYARFVAPFDYEVTTRDVFIENLPPAFDNFRITQITDLHHSDFVPLDEVQRVVALANETKPDLFALTGDFTTDNHPEYLAPCIEALRALEAPHGVLAVLGNHDQHRRARLQTDDMLRRGGLQLLLNDNTRIVRGADELPIAGVDDVSWGRLDWQRASKGIDFRRATILLSHQPIVFDEDWARRFSLTLAGHTHGGQVALPLIGAPARVMRQFKFIGGLFARETSQMYVSRGTGMVGLPLRFGARPEIAVLRLRHAEMPRS